MKQTTKHLFLLFILLLVLSVGQLIGQTDTINHKPKEQKKHYFGFGMGLIFNAYPQLVYSPCIQLHPSKHFYFYVGPSFLIRLDEVHLKNKNSFRIGTSYSPWSKKIKPYIKFEFSRIKYEFNSTLYDYAVPGIPIKATVLNEYKSFGFNPSLGVNYKIKNRFYINSDAGVKFDWETTYESGTLEGYLYQQYGEKTQSEFNLWFTFSIETGIYF